MDFFVEIADEQRISSAQKRSIPIGIFGSFWPRNQPYLIAIRDWLREDGYDARISLDLSIECPQGADEDDDSYNLRISHRLLDTSTIHLFVFFVEGDAEHNINQSASMELERLFVQDRRQNALFIREEGVLEQSGGYLRGRWAEICRDLPWEPFSRDADGFETAIELKTAIRQFCLQRIHTRIQMSAAGEERL